MRLEPSQLLHSKLLLLEICVYISVSLLFTIAHRPGKVLTMRRFVSPQPCPELPRFDKELLSGIRASDFSTMQLIVPLHTRIHSCLTSICSIGPEASRPALFLGVTSKVSLCLMLACEQLSIASSPDSARASSREVMVRAGAKTVSRADGKGLESKRKVLENWFLKISRSLLMLYLASNKLN